MTSKITCILVDDEPMAREILSTYIAKTPQLKLLAACSSATEALEVLQSTPVDLIFLDINMPEVSGLSLAKAIHQQTQLIFTTAYREYALDGFELNAIDYLLKPIAFDRFLTAIRKLSIPKSNRSEATGIFDDFMFVRADRKMIKVNFQDIIYIESLSDYLKIHCHSQTLTIRETISNIEQRLPTHQFLRTHRSYIISIPQILSYTNEYIEVVQKAIPISRSYKEIVLQKLESF
ncbi:Two-component system response regulator [Tenacibaculum litopenaei]|uniref:LytR/AlgR family response regulator transcription factor n=1 Tax=Tenacibaculum litopenaei TaxID=396016 RepID=UPI003896330D